MIVDPEMVFTLAVTIYEGRLTALFTTVRIPIRNQVLGVISSGNKVRGKLKTPSALVLFWDEILKKYSYYLTKTHP
jgi:hypothetical protein